MHAWMEEWLQCEWWNWKVYTANVTEEFAQIGIAGPNARQVLGRLTGMDLDPETFPFMNWASGTLGGFDARVFRISFSGEISYEVAVKANEGLAMWEALVDAGKDLGIQPYGTEALHVLRAEKGYVMIGDETDGTVTPQDLGLDWAISRKRRTFSERGRRSDPSEPSGQMAACGPQDRGFGS